MATSTLPNDGHDRPPVIIAPVVEGFGEVNALPRVLFRLAHDLSVTNLRVTTPFRSSRGKLIAPGGIERAVSAAALQVTGPGGILVLIDADDDCPAQLGPRLLARAQNARSDKQISVVLAMREFESWYLASATSLAGIHDFPANLTGPHEPETVRGAKEWLTRNRPDGRPYKETADQAALASIFDITMARTNSVSFDKFCRDVEALLKGGQDQNVSEVQDL